MGELPLEPGRELSLEPGRVLSLELGQAFSSELEGAADGDVFKTRALQRRIPCGALCSSP